MEDHVPRHAQMGAWVLINDRWYKLGAAAANRENPESLDRSDNNGGTGRNSRLDFAPDSNGVYAISVQAWNSRDTGTYTVEVEEVM